MRLLVRLIKLLPAAALVLMALLCLWQLGARIVLGQELPQTFGYSHLAVLSGSMEPEISAGDLVVIRRQTAYQPGDIITFDEGGVFTTHRIMEIRDDGFCTKGDANNTPDSRPVPFERVVGRVILVIPGAGKVLLFLRSPAGMLGILLSGAAVLFLTERIGLRKGEPKPNE